MFKVRTERLKARSAPLCQELRAPQLCFFALVDKCFFRPEAIEALGLYAEFSYSVKPIFF
jgi:hypothetical protein